MDLTIARQRAGLTVAHLAALSGVSVATIEQVEAGTISPSNFTAACLAFALREKVPA